MSLDLLFDPSVIDLSISEGLPAGYAIRPLSRQDYSKGYFENLQTLTWTGNVTEERFLERYDWMKAKGDGWFYNVVVEHEGKIVGNGVLIVERKFIWDLAMCGHIEEMSISKSYQGTGLGRRIMEALTGIARKVGCCKVILNCGDEKVPFYEKCGYEKSGLEMEVKFPGFSDSSSSSSS